MEKLCYKGNYIQVTEEQIGSHLWERVYLRNGLIIFPIDDQENIVIINEHRPHETPKERWKFVTGIYEDDMSFEENVNRELQEEIGFKSKNIHKFHEINYTGTINNKVIFALATDLVESKLPNPDGDVIKEIRPVALKELTDLIISGQMPWSLASLGAFKLTYHPELLKKDS